MNSITRFISTSSFVYGAFAIAVTAVMVFAVLPQFPQVASTFDKITVSATSVFAFGGSGDGGCCGGDGGGGVDNPGGPGDPPAFPAPSCDFLRANPTTVSHNGGDVTLTWGTTGATRVTINQGIGRVPADGSRTVFVDETTTFTLTVVGFGGTDTCTVRVTVEPPAPEPASCDSFTASRSTVPHNGANVTLTWNTTNATSVSINNGIGNVPADGSRTVFVDSTRTYTLTAVGADGNDTCQVRITKQDAPAAASCDSFTASRSTVPHNGANVTLTWNTTNATSVSINNGIGNVAADGSRTVFVDETTTFTLTAVGAGGNDTCQVRITKQPAPSAAACDFLSANRTSLPDGGGNVTLSWGTTNATSVSINNGIGNVADDGSRTVFVDDTTTFVLTAVGAGGNDTCQVTVHVDEEEPAPRCDFLRVSDDDVEEGDEVTLTWETTNADDVELNQGIGDVADDGSRRVRVDRDTTFVLTVEGNGQEDTCSVRVEVEEEEEDDEPRPRCELRISDDKVKKGDEVTIEWETRDAEEVVIEDDRGNVIFRDRSVSRNDEGEVEVEITRDTEFTLNAEGDGGDRECEVDVEIEDEAVVVLTERETPRVAGISLTQVPYTGFEAGPTLTFLFYALVTAWAFGIAYVLVIRKDTVFGFALPSFRREEIGTIHEDRIVASEAYTPSVATIPHNLPTAETVVGYGSLYENETAEEEVTEADDALSAIEEHAHAHRILLSSDALRYVESHLVAENGMAGLDLLIGAAKAAYPSEDGWVVLNLARVQELVGDANTAVATDTLAAAIVRGDVASAYRLIENRPMVTLASAAAELDAAYRAQQAGNASAPFAERSSEELKAAVEALTSALDGTYTDEQSAVKVAVMKAINVFNG